MTDFVTCYLAGCANVSYWAWLGTLYLIFLTWKDFKNKMRVDDRHNYLMMGLSISLYAFVKPPLWYVLVIVGLVLFLNWFFKKFESLGGADVTTLSWVFLGLGVINAFKLAWFCVFFLIISGLYFFFKLVVFKYDKPTPFYPVLLITYVFNMWFFGLYSGVL